YPIALIADLLAVSRSGYYDWCDRPMSKCAIRHLVMRKQVQDTFEEHDEIYGSCKISEDLEERSIKIT
ncbi:MAG: putative transposase, partial [Phycisphaerales bacterium]